jgi:hypothetical protein
MSIVPVFKHRGFEVYLKDKLTGEEKIALREYLDYLRDGECNPCEEKIISIADTTNN